MKEKIQSLIKDQKSFVADSGNPREVYKWEAIIVFQKNWDIDANDFYGMFKKSFSGKSNLMYQNSFGFLDKLGQTFPEKLKQLFKLIYETDRSFEDILKSARELAEKHLMELRKAYNRENLNHQFDERALSFLLVLRYPDKYYLYMSGVYKAICNYLEIKPNTIAGKKYSHFAEVGDLFINEFKSDNELLASYSNFIPEEFEFNSNKLIFQDIVYTQLVDIAKAKTIKDLTNVRENESNSHNIKNMEKSPLNQILYGPPGTGKTYKTIDLAVKIAAPEKYDSNNHAENKIIYDELVEKEQIVFTTFHQSMSYEDFVEGIKPSKPELEDQYLKYEIEDGIFKQIVEKSIGESKISDISGNIVIDSKYFDLMINKVSLGNSNVQEDDAIYDYCINNDCIAIGFGEDINFEGVKTKAEIRKKFKDNGIEVTSTSDFNVAAMERFVLWMKRGQLVFVPNGNQTLRSIGVVDGDYYYQENSPIPYKQFRKVKWLYKEVNLPIKEIYGKKFSQQTIYQIGSNENMIQFFSKNRSSKKQENYVLIIDEINRGNVSQIFGELITLIEPDKRKGAANEIKIKLPYSKDSEKLFSVPQNLYIIGTMNTADRSVEALDSALRRRFSFEELMPNPNLLSPENMIVRLWNHPDYFEAEWKDPNYRTKATALYDFLGTNKSIEEKFKGEEYQNDKNWDVEMLGKLEDLNGINLETALTTINERIEVLIDRDHTIGHSYFMGLEVTENIEEATKAVFRDKVIPLLQEYFFNDYGKIQLVLGEGFVGKKPKSKDLFPVKHEEIDLDEYLQKPNYFFKIDQDNFDLKEAITILFKGKTSESTVLHNVS